MGLPRIAWMAACLALASAAAQARDLDFDRLERALRLNPIQQQQFDVAVKTTHRALLAVGLGVLQIKLRLGQELLKDRPDPGAVAQAQEELAEMSQPHIRAARDEWLRFYALLDEDQVAFARFYIEESLRSVERLGEHLGKHFFERPQRP